MNLKNPGFGGPKSAQKLRSDNGKIINSDRKLQNFQHTVERHEAFKHDVYNPTYKAMGGDLVNKQEKGENPYDYDDLYDNMGIATVERGSKHTSKPKYEVGHTNEGKCYDFATFVLESAAPENEEEIWEDCEEEIEDDEELKEGKKWIGDAIKQPGALRKKMGKKEGEKITIGEIDKKLNRLDADKKKPGVQAKGAENKKEVKQLNLAKTLKRL